LVEAIAQLRGIYRDVLLLIALGGLSHQAAGEKLSVMAKAIEMRVRRAKRQLASRPGR
jgi:DNA-directed RNA polymerase specialized sigma24 family protein